MRSVLAEDVVRRWWWWMMPPPTMGAGEREDLLSEDGIVVAASWAEVLRNMER